MGASHIYGSARPSYIKLLDPIQNQGLRLALGAFRTSPQTSLQVEANIPSLENRRKQLGLQYALRLSSNPKNPAFSCVFNIPHDIRNTISNNDKKIKPFGLRIEEDLRTLDFSKDNIESFAFSKIPPWLLINIPTDLELTKHKKIRKQLKNTENSILKSHKKIFQCRTNLH